MKAGWDFRPLHELSAINYGYTKSASPDPVGPKFLRITDIQDDRVNWDDVPYCTIEKTNEEKYRLQTGDIVFARTGATTGKSFLVEEPPDAVFASYLIRLRLLNGRLLPKFLALFFQSEAYWKSIQEGATGSAQGGFNATKLGNLEIPIPPLAEQRRIVGILDKAFAAIATAKANTEKNLENARALFESELHSIFSRCGDSWISAKIGDCIGFIDYRGRTPKKTEAGLRLITAKNVKMGYLQRTPEEFVSPSSYKTWMTRGIPRCGDVLFTTEAPLASVAQLDTSEKVVFAQRIIIMQPDRARLDPTFLKYLLLSPPVQQRIRAKGTGATVQGIKARLLKEIPISFPSSLTEQANVVTRLNDLKHRASRVESACSQKLLLLDELKTSLLREAFTGSI